MKKPFKDVWVGEYFWCNGNYYYKRSHRTADLLLPKEYSGVWFYFGMNDLCEVAQ